MNQELQMVMDTLISEMGKMEARINDRMDERFSRQDERFEAIDKRFETIDERFEAIDKRFEAIDKRFEAIDKRFGALDKRLDRMDRRIRRTEKDMKLYVNMLVDEIGRVENKMDHRFKQVDARLDSMQHEINGCKLAVDTVSLLMQRVDQHENRITRLENTSGIGRVVPVGN